MHGTLEKNLITSREENYRLLKELRPRQPRHWRQGAKLETPEIRRAHQFEDMILCLRRSLIFKFKSGKDQSGFWRMTKASKGMVGGWSYHRPDILSTMIWLCGLDDGL